MTVAHFLSYSSLLTVGFCVAAADLRTAPDYHQADLYPQSYDSTWRGPVTEPDMYRHNVWDPVIGFEEYGWHYDWHPEEGHWKPGFGWHTGKFDYAPEDQRREPRQGNRPKRLTGTVESIRTLRLRNRSQEVSDRAVARVTLEDGKVILVDFGDVNGNPELILRPNEKVTIVGRVGKINGHHVLFAEAVRQDGTSVRLLRKGYSFLAGKSHSRDEKLAVFSGVVLDASTILLNNEAGQTKRLIQIELESGGMALIETGSDATLQELGIAKGEWILVRGERHQISRRTFISAQELRINGEEVELPVRRG